MTNHRSSPEKMGEQCWKPFLPRTNRQVLGAKCTCPSRPTPTNRMTCGEESDLEQAQRQLQPLLGPRHKECPVQMQSVHSGGATKLPLPSLSPCENFSALNYGARQIAHSWSR